MSIDTLSIIISRLYLLSHSQGPATFYIGLLYSGRVETVKYYIIMCTNCGQPHVRNILKQHNVMGTTIFCTTTLHKPLHLPQHLQEHVVLHGATEKGQQSKKKGKRVLLHCQ